MQRLRCTENNFLEKGMEREIKHTNGSYLVRRNFEKPNFLLKERDAREKE